MEDAERMVTPGGLRGKPRHRDLDVLHAVLLRLVREIRTALKRVLSQTLAKRGHRKQTTPWASLSFSTFGVHFYNT